MLAVDRRLHTFRSHRHLGRFPTGAVDAVLDLFRYRGGSEYTIDRVTQREHALQCARLARACGQPEPFIAAALLHDIGHMLCTRNQDIADMHRDLRHEAVGAAWIERRFGREVSEPVRLHVAAKRYLCAVDGDYLDCLSDASMLSLTLQGGPMNGVECEAFEQSPWHEQALLLRRLDDQAKEPGLQAPPLEDYEPLLLALAARCLAVADRLDLGAARD
jgi:phosphonate degradation associated HDIG domain protein